MTQRLMTLLDITRPVLSAPMAGASGPDLVAAVCNVGGYGVIPLWTGIAEDVGAGIDELGTLTGGTFAVNLNMSFP